MDKRITCSDCPLYGVGTDELCEDYCSDMADFIEEIRADAIDEFETRILGNCSLMLKDGERVIVIRQDIFQFIAEQMQKGEE